MSATSRVERGRTSGDRGSTARYEQQDGAWVITFDDLAVTLGHEPVADLERAVMVVDDVPRAGAAVWQYS